MRSTIACCLLLATAPLPVLAQSNVEQRVGRLESEMRAVQRKVFPGGSGPYVEPQITAPEQQIQGPGAPASGAIEDLTGRVASLEGQLATLTGQIEQNQYRIRQLEERFDAYRKATDARLAAAPAEAEAAPAPEAEAPRPATRPAATKPAPAATGPAPSGERAALVAAVQRQSTGDAGEDAYMYGYRLWAAKLYPEAAVQLKSVVAQYPDHRRASYAQNLLGRTYLDDNKPSLASIALYENYKKRPDGERAPDSLYYLSQALMRLNKPADACKVYSELTDVYGSKISAEMKANVERGRVAAKCR